MLLFNRYKYNPNTDLIGKGNFSRVYKARDEKSDETVALKLYKTEPLYTRIITSPVSKSLTELDHPSINKYFAIEEIEKEDAFGETEKIQVCVMEQADEGNIKDYYSRTQDADILKKLLQDVIKGISFLHKQGIIHRHIKPSNILVHTSKEAPGKKAKISDYGIISGTSEETTISSALTISIPYLAPEELNPQKYAIDEKISFNIDIWLLGLSVYEIITGEPLFMNSKRESSEQVMKNITDNSLPDKINQLPEPFKAFVTACLVKDARKRPQHAEELLPLFENISEKNATVARNKKKRAPIKEDNPKIVTTTKDSSGEDDTSVISIHNKSEIVDSTPAADDTYIIVQEGITSTPSDDTSVIATDAKYAAGSDDTSILSEPVANSTSPDDTQIITNASKNEQSPGLTPITKHDQKEGAIILFNRYEYLPVTDLIGKGGFSRVYKAYDKKLSRWVALKIYKTNNLSDKYSPFAEIKRVINLDHGNICRYLDIEEMENINPFGETEKIQVCVMELLDSGNISEYYKLHPNPAILKKLLQDILNGLSYLHKKGIIHRDIKPANILIKEGIEGPVAKITDFGISKVSDSVSNNSSSALIVSIPFMAPEQFNAKKYGIDEKISFNLDLWSLGVTIYEVYTGEVLFKDNEHDNSEQIMANIMAPELPEKINHLPQPFKDIVSKCLVKDAKNRAQRSDELMIFFNKKYESSASIATPASGAEIIDEKIKVIKQQPVSGVAPKETNDKAKEKEKKQMTGLKKISFSLDSPAEEEPFRKNTNKLISKKSALIGGGIILLIIYFLFTKIFVNENQIINTLSVTDSTAIDKNNSLNDTAQKQFSTNTNSQKDSTSDQKENVLPSKSTDVKKDITSGKENKQNKSNTKKQDATKFLLELSTVEACSLLLNDRPFTDLAPGAILQTSLKPGEYILKAINTKNNKVYFKIITVRPYDIGTSARINIKF